MLMCHVYIYTSYVYILVEKTVLYMLWGGGSTLFSLPLNHEKPPLATMHNNIFEGGTGSSLKGVRN